MGRSEELDITIGSQSKPSYVAMNGRNIVYANAGGDGGQNSGGGSGFSGGGGAGYSCLNDPTRSGGDGGYSGSDGEAGSGGGRAGSGSGFNLTSVHLDFFEFSAGDRGRHMDSRGGGGGGVLVRGVNLTKVSGRGVGAGQGASAGAEDGCVVLE